MKFFTNIYTVIIYEDRKFCWRVEKRKKTKDDYRSDAELGLLYVAFAMILFLLVI